MQKESEACPGVLLDDSGTVGDFNREADPGDCGCTMEMEDT